VPDRMEIIDLYARYNHAADTGDVDGYVDLFTADGEFSSPVRTAKGTAEIHAFIALRSAALTAAPVRDEQHWNCNLVLDPVGEEVAGSIYMVGIGRDADTGSVRFNFFGRYFDRIVRGTDGRWRFSSRRFDEHMTEQRILR